MWIKNCFFFFLSSSFLFFTKEYKLFVSLKSFPIHISIRMSIDLLLCVCVCALRSMPHEIHKQHTIVHNDPNAADKNEINLIDIYTMEKLRRIGKQSDIFSSKTT